MHDYILGFVCFMLGALFVVVMGISLFGGQSEDAPPPAGQASHAPPVEPQRWPRPEPDPHPAWPECDCPSETFHAKYYPSAGVG